MSILNEPKSINNKWCNQLFDKKSDKYHLPNHAKKWGDLNALLTNQDNKDH